MSIDRIAEMVVAKVGRSGGAQSVLVAVSGIDGSGKTTIARRLADELAARDLCAALIHLDAWHTPPELRFGGPDPGEHFYAHAFRFDELFARLVRPLREARSIRLTTELTRLPENDRFAHTYDFADVDVIILEGVFILKPELARDYDLAFWVECSFETALRRALARNQEGLSEAEIIRDYETIYFAAQRIHLARDDPRTRADAIIDNDTPA